MKSLRKFSVFAIFIALLCAQSLFADRIYTEGVWSDEYYRSLDAPQPPAVSIEGDILSLAFGDALSDLTVCVLNSNGEKVYEEVISSGAGTTYSISLAGEASGQYQIVMLHKLGHLTGDFTLE